MFRSLSLAVFLLLFAPVDNLRAELATCVQPAAHKAVTVLLVDRSDVPENVGPLKQVFGLLRQSIQPGERLISVMVTDKLSHTRIELDVTRPEGSMWESALKLRAQEKHFVDCVTALETELSTKKETYKTTAILETLSFIANLVNSESSASKRVVILSDMLQNSEAVSFYGNASVDPAKAMKKAEAEHLLVKLPKVSVYVTGTGGAASDKKARAVEEFWQKYFKHSGAVLKFYGPTLLGL